MATDNPTINVGGVERPMTEEELAVHAQTIADVEREIEAQAVAVAAKESAKAKLAALGLTDEEINAIIGGV